uniref:ATP-binding cassette domain-containing protein n=1 Tax=Salinibaculum salinum TaxID=3131996 RepID=UPI0030EEB052
MASDTDTTSERETESTETKDPSGEPLVDTTPNVGATASESESHRTAGASETIIETRDLNVFYGETQALQNINMEIPRNQVTAMVGPSGCGKSTFLRCINRMNDLVDAARIEGELLFRGKNVYDDDVDPVALRRKIG